MPCSRIRIFLPNTRAVENESSVIIINPSTERDAASVLALSIYLRTCVPKHLRYPHLLVFATERSLLVGLYLFPMSYLVIDSTSYAIPTLP